MESITRPTSVLPGPPANSIAALLGYAIAGLGMALVLYLCANEVVRWRARMPGFGGPPGWPVVGNLFDVLDYSAQTYQRWAATYGDVYQVQLANTPVLVINSGAAAKKLFITHSQAFSSRPITYTFGKVR